MMVVASGYFDPLHVGHLEYLEKAKALGGRLIVIVNNDRQAVAKKGRAFMPEGDRLRIVEALRVVDRAVLSVDDGPDVSRSIRNLVLGGGLEAGGERVVFAKGGDRKVSEIPEAETCRRLGIEVVDGLGEKIRSSADFTGLREVSR